MFGQLPRRSSEIVRTPVSIAVRAGPVRKTAKMPNEPNYYLHVMPLVRLKNRPPVELGCSGHEVGTAWPIGHNWGGGAGLRAMIQ